MDKQKKTTPNAYKISISTNAVRNLDEITGYIAFVNQQPINAIKVGETILDTLQRIELHPYSFRECDSLPTKSKMYRQAVCMSWNIIFKVTNTDIRILGIIHSSRKPTNLKTLIKK